MGLRKQKLVHILSLELAVSSFSEPVGWENSGIRPASHRVCVSAQNMGYLGNRKKGWDALEIEPRRLIYP